VAHAFTRLEIFGGRTTVEMVRRLFLDDRLREQLMDARRQYVAKVLQLPDCYDALCTAVSLPLISAASECPPHISSC
jgi:hypothetical protein